MLRLKNYINMIFDRLIYGIQGLEDIKYMTKNDKMWIIVIVYDQIWNIHIGGRLIHEEVRARQVILFGDQLALQPGN